MFLSQLGQHQYESWIRPQPQPDIRDCGDHWQVIFRLASRFKLDWFRTHLGAATSQNLQQALGKPVELHFVLAARERATPLSANFKAPLAGAAFSTKVAAKNRLDSKADSSSSTVNHATENSAASPLPPSVSLAPTTGRPRTTKSGKAVPAPTMVGQDAAAAASTSNSNNAADAVAQTAPAFIPAPRTEEAQRLSGLNSRQTFDTLIVGKSNQMAHAAASQVGSHPGHSYNPLFIYGGVGLGKTHLLHAIGNLAISQGRHRVQYIHAERFVSDVVRAYQRRNFDAFKQHYHSLDVLLIDDVQFFAGKDKTQEEFFYAFEALLNQSSQVVLTSDTYPRALREMDQRLLSRFDAGLTVAVEPPEMEMRVAILKQNAALAHTMLPDDVAFYIAKNVRSNVRELEGSLRKVLANASFSQKPITVEMARLALRDFISAVNRTVSVDNIQKTVAQFYRISVEELLSRQRPQHIALPRQIAMYLSKELTQKSLPDLGLLFAGRDHTTILHAYRKIAAQRATSPEFNQQLHILEQSIKG